MSKIHVRFDADLFKMNGTFEFQGDDGRYTPCSKEANEVLQRLVDDPKQESICYQHGNMMYEVKLRADGTITQANMQTDRVRIVRSLSLRDQIKAWFAQHGNGQVPGVYMEMLIDTTTFPNSPPFVRVLRPRFKFHTGHVTIGGSLCTEVLTSAWSSENDPFALLILLQNNLIDGNGQIDFQNVYDYTEREAQEAFARVANHHGWTVKHQKS